MSARLRLAIAWIRHAAVAGCLLGLAGCADRQSVIAPEHAAPAMANSQTDAFGWRIFADGVAIHAGAGTGDTIFIEVPANQAVSISWLAVPPGGDEVEYRWVIDPQPLSLGFRRPRFGYEWTPWTPDVTQARIGPFPGGVSHFITVEARDVQGAVSRRSARINWVAASFEGELLIVDDTRRLPDQIQGACAALPSGPWPTAAELDTFLFARGGFPWKCYLPGTLSEPGLFEGFHFDTLGTRTGNPDPTVPLSTLLRYRHVIWIVDAASARMTNPAGGPVDPITALRYMSGPGRENTLAEYVRSGGKLWLLGGGAAQATLLPWNSTSNDGGFNTWSNHTGELVPGRFMYDLVHWRSEIKAATAPMFVNRYLGRSPVWPGVPDYGRLPAQLGAKSAALDPFPPGRSGQSGSVFYKSTLDAEFLSLQNFITENGESTLDSLYRIITFALPPVTHQRVNMTYYHGEENAPVLFSGFDIWSFTRADCQALVEFVLQDVWGLARTAPPQAIAGAAGPRR
jgi:hypothetical protein